MAHPAYLEIAVEGEDPRFLPYDPQDKAHRAELRRQAAEGLASWLRDFGHVLPSADVERDQVSLIIARLQR